MQNDDWLVRWLPEIKQKVGNMPLLELGCGWGWDTAVFTQEGIAVVAVDISQQALDKAKKEAPAATFYCQDIRESFPLEVEPYRVIVASLSLHYFSWPETAVLVERIHRALAPQGIFLCRLNSTKDLNHGAQGYPEIATNYYLVKEKRKRFFDEDAVSRLFQNGWKKIAMQEMEIDRFHLPKIVWEIVLEKQRR